MIVLEATFHTEHQRLFRYFRRRTDADLATDLVQEVFARAAKGARLEQADNPAAYLARIARNLLIDRARQAGRDRVLFFPLDERYDVPTPPEQTWDIEAAELLGCYRHTIEAMPPKTRRVFLLHRIEQRTYREIGEQLGISIPTVQYHVVRALSLLRETLAAWQSCL
ncbi:RNA polymerase sigma factor [Novosphingobium sp.]|uniref:RNA polymerase sigma factor n=1 Tax=Novosphingobium sp. TaxID=1874826 RepID=UPI00352B4763